MNPLRVLIADDEPLARSNVRVLLEKDPEVGCIIEASDGEAAARLIPSENPDLVFLDVQMPGLDGFGVIAKLGEKVLPPVVFITAYDQYATRAFDIHAIDYLLKPFSNRRFAEALDRAKAAGQRGLDSEDRRLRDLLRFLETQKSREEPLKDRIIIRSAGDLFFLRTEDVYWLEAQGDYVKIHTREKGHLIRETMGHLEDTLDPNQFLRVHRSTIVNLKHVKRLSPLSFGDYVLWLSNGAEVKVSRTFHARLSAHLGA